MQSYAYLANYPILPFFLFTWNHIKQVHQFHVTWYTKVNLICLVFEIITWIFWRKRSYSNEGTWGLIPISCYCKWEVILTNKLPTALKEVLWHNRIYYFHLLCYVSMNIHILVGHILLSSISFTVSQYWVMRKTFFARIGMYQNLKFNHKFRRWINVFNKIMHGWIKSSFL